MQRKTRKSLKVFNKEDFTSGDGMLTTVWGPSQWHFLHTISFNYPTNPTEQQKEHYKNYIMSLLYILPCKYCRINFKKNLKKMPLTKNNFKNREAFSRYIYELHELINTMLGKKSGLSYDDVQERYENFRARCSSVKNIDKNKIKMGGKRGKNTTKKTKKKETEMGCTEPLFGTKSKCILKFVPQSDECGETIQIDKRCLTQRLP
jgi:hypothetical protein